MSEWVQKVHWVISITIFTNLDGAFTVRKRNNLTTSVSLLDKFPSRTTKVISTKKQWCYTTKWNTYHRNLVKCVTLSSNYASSLCIIKLRRLDVVKVRLWVSFEYKTPSILLILVTFFYWIERLEYRWVSYSIWRKIAHLWLTERPFHRYSYKYLLCIVVMKKMVVSNFSSGTVVYLYRSILLSSDL